MTPNAQLFQIGNDEQGDVVKLLHIVSFAAGDMGDMTTPQSLPMLFRTFFKPDFDHKRASIELI
jgi:hypothetical protein